MQTQRAAWLFHAKSSLVSLPVDFLVFVACPFLIAAVLLTTIENGHAAILPAAVAILFTWFHDLPGFWRVYSDRRLFQNYQLRLTIIPILLFASCVSLSLLDFHTFLTLIVLWRVKHGAGQNYGIARLYEVKNSTPADCPRLLDKSFHWIWAAAAFNPVMSQFLRGQNIAAFCEWLDPVLMALAAAVSFALLVNLVQRIRSNRPVPLMKYGFSAATACLFLILREVGMRDRLFFFCLHEAVHALQYFAITGISNVAGLNSLKQIFFEKSSNPRPWYLLAGLILVSAGVARLGGLVGSFGGPTQKLFWGSFSSMTVVAHYYFDGFAFKRKTEPLISRREQWKDLAVQISYLALALAAVLAFEGLLKIHG